YLVILGAVLLVALVIVSLLGWFPSLGGATKEQQSKAYWTSASPFSVVTSKLTGSNISLRIRNQGAEKLMLSSIEFGDESNGTIAVFSPNQVMNAGEEADFTNLAFTVSNPCAGTGKVGTPYEFSNLSFLYSQGLISDMRQVGAERFVGFCS
ncbi:MAG: hypothetical protein WCX64_01620, partial [Candidatus Micrarchaeia archaeon]